MKDLRIAIVGAGIGGLTAALAMQRAGYKVTVHEQASELGEVGAGLSLSPSAAHALRYLGLGPALDAAAYLPEDQAVRHYQDGRALQWTNRGHSLLEKYGERYYLIHRADLHDALASAVRAKDRQAIQLERRCIGVTQSDRQARVEFEGGATVTADVVIGADGSPINAPEDLMVAVAKHRAGETITLQVVRQGQIGTVRVKLGRPPEP